MSNDEQDPVCPECHADLAADDPHSQGCPLDLPEDDDPRPLAEERSVLGAMMLDPSAIALASSMLRAEHFTKPGHRDLFEAICELWDRGDPVDPVSVSANLTGARLVRVGGALYVHSLIRDVPTAANVGYYAAIVRDRFRRTEIADALHRAVGIANEGDHNQTPGNLEAIRDLIEAVTEERDEDGGSQDGVWLHEAIDAEVASWDEPEEQGILSGFADFDEVVGGFRPGQLIIVAARPGIGKSALSTDWGRYAAEHGNAVLLFSLEMSRRDVMQRLISAKATVRLHNIRHRTWSDEDRHKMKLASDGLQQVVFRISDTHDVSMTHLRSVARQMKRSRTGLDLLIVDYLQLMSSGTRVENRQQEVSEFSRGLKSLAKELNVPIVALSQLNRGPEQRTGKKPMLSDLRESGSLEQDADIVVLISRPDALEPEHKRAGEADLILAKHRNGATTTVTVVHQLRYSRFADITRGGR